MCGTATADVQSANVVGYTTTPIEAGRYYLVATQFKDTGNNVDMIGIDKLVSLSNITPSDFKSAAQGNGIQIQFLRDSGSGYTTYYYVSDPKDSAGVVQSNPGWVATSGKLASLEIGLGTGFWFKTAIATEDSSATFCGEVKSDVSSKDVALREGYSLISNPFPVDVVASMLTIDGIVPTTFKDAAQGNGIQLQVLRATGSGYTTYYYVSDPKDASGVVQSNPGWVATSGKLTTTALAKAGEGFWMKTPSAGTLKISMGE